MTRRPATTQLLEVHLEELGAHSWVKALFNTLTGSNGTALFRFVARPVAGEHREAEHVAVSATFSMPRWADLNDLTEPNGWSNLAREQLAELERELQAAGWERSLQQGDHWWSLRFTR